MHGWGKKRGTITIHETNELNINQVMDKIRGRCHIFTNKKFLKLLFVKKSRRTKKHPQLKVYGPMRHNSVQFLEDEQKYRHKIDVHSSSCSKSIDKCDIMINTLYE